MIYLYAFLFSGLICLVSQIVYDNFPVTPGHITTFYVVLGAILSIFGIYDKLIDFAGGGATCLIINFSNLLVKGMNEGLEQKGFLGIFTSAFSYGAVLSFTIFMGGIGSLVSRSKH